MSEADLFGDPTAPEGAPAGDPAAADPAAAPAAPASPDALAQVLEAVNGLGARLSALEGRGGNAAPPPQNPSAPPAPPADPQAAFNEMYANPTAFVDARAKAAAQEAMNGLAGQLTPFFNTVASQLADRGVDAAREQMDSTMGAGAFDRLVGNDLSIALAQLPAGQRADANYVRALASGVLGGKMLDPNGQKEIREVMAAARTRPAAPVVLTGNSAQPPRDRLTDAEREQIAAVCRSGIAVDEKSFLESRNRPRTEEAFGATWMNPAAPVRRTN